MTGFIVLMAAAAAGAALVAFFTLHDTWLSRGL